MLIDIDLHSICAHPLKVDRLEQMLGSYGPRQEPYSKDFESDDSPSGLLARSGTYSVTSLVVDDDKEIYARACHLLSISTRKAPNKFLSLIRMELVLQARKGMVKHKERITFASHKLAYCRLKVTTTTPLGSCTLCTLFPFSLFPTPLSSRW